MYKAALIKLAFWMTLVGGVAQLTPNPAWPQWLAEGVMWSGIGIGLGMLLYRAWQLDRERNRRRREGSPSGRP